MSALIFVCEDVYRISLIQWILNILHDPKCHTPRSISTVVLEQGIHSKRIKIRNSSRSSKSRSSTVAPVDGTNHSDAEKYQRRTSCRRRLALWSGILQEPAQTLNSQTMTGSKVFGPRKPYLRLQGYF